MPIYTYVCTSCHAHMESFQKMRDTPLVTCSTCGNDSLIKIPSASGFKLNGTGWYETDFKTKKKD